MREIRTLRGVSSEGWHVQQGQTCRGRSQSPVVWIAEEMENRTFEAYRQDLPRGGYESPGRNNSERIVASKMKIPRVEPATVGRRQNDQPKTDRYGCSPRRGGS